MNFFKNLNDKTDINNCLEFTQKLDFFYSESSFLWRNLIGKKLQKNEKEEDCKNYLNQIKTEKANLDKLSTLDQSVLKDTEDNVEVLESPFI